MSKKEKRERQGRLTVVGEAGVDESGRRLVKVKCDCGSPLKVLVYKSFHGNRTQSCGCLQVESVVERNTVHGHHARGVASPTYEAWRSMLARCYNESCESYPYYGGAGIGVYRQWRDSFEAFLADVGEKPEGDYVLCLLDKTKDFAPGNVKWLTKYEADRTKRSNTFYTVNGVTKCLVDWAKEYDIPKNTLHYRVVTKGMSMRDALDVGRGRSGKVLPA